MAKINAGSSGARRTHASARGLSLPFARGAARSEEMRRDGAAACVDFMGWVPYRLLLLTTGVLGRLVRHRVGLLEGLIDGGGPDEGRRDLLRELGGDVLALGERQPATTHVGARAHARVDDVE